MRFYYCNYNKLEYNYIIENKIRVVNMNNTAKTNKYEMDMCNGPLLNKLIIFSIPLILSGMLQLLFNAADVIVVGQYAGKEALAAVGSTSSLTNLLINVFIGLSVGANVLVARFYGAGQKKELDEMIHTAIATSLIAGIFLIFVGFFVAKPAFAFMETPEDVIDQSVLYMRIYFAGMPVLMLYNFGSAILRAIGDTKRPLYYLLFAGVINVILNLIFVIYFHMGVAGVALATVISQAISAVLVIRCLILNDGIVCLDLKKLCIVPDKLFKMIRIGVPAGLQGAMFSISNVLIQSSINTFGSVAMAGNTAALNIEGFIYTAMNALHQGAVSFTGQNFGAHKFRRIAKITIICEGMVIAVGILLSVIVLIFVEPLLSLYSGEAEVIQYGIKRLQIICSTYFLCGMMDVMVGILRGMGYAIAPMIVSLTGVCAFRVVWIYTVFKNFHTLEVLYLSYPVTWTVTFLVQLIMFLIIYRKYKGMDMSNS